MALSEDNDWIRHEFRRVEHLLAQPIEQWPSSMKPNDTELLPYVQPEPLTPGRRTRPVLGLAAAACLVLALFAGVNRIRPNEFRPASATQPIAMVWAVSDHFANFKPSSMAVESDTNWDSTYCEAICRNAAFSIRTFKNGTFPDESPATFGTKIGTHSIRMADGTTLTGDIRVLPTAVAAHTFELALAGDLRFEIYSHGLTDQEFLELLGTIHGVTEEQWKARAEAAVSRPGISCDNKPGPGTATISTFPPPDPTKCGA
jgi:hypothetical protein